MLGSCLSFFGGKQIEICRDGRAFRKTGTTGRMAGRGRYPFPAVPERGADHAGLSGRIGVQPGSGGRVTLFLCDDVNGTRENTVMDDVVDMACEANYELIEQTAAKISGAGWGRIPGKRKTALQGF